MIRCFFSPKCSRTRIMKTVSLTNYPPPWFQYRNRERENCLCSHYSFYTMNKCSLFWAVLGSRFLLKTSPLLLHQWHLLTNNSSSSLNGLHLQDVGCGQFCGCACLRLSQNQKVGSYPSLTNQPLTGQTASAVHQVLDMCRAGGGRRVPAF